MEYLKIKKADYEDLAEKDPDTYYWIQETNKIIRGETPVVPSIEWRTYEPEPVLAPGLYDAEDNLLCSWEDSGIDASKTYTYGTYKTDAASPYYVITNTYPTTTKVIIPDTVTSIGNYAFDDCTSLTSVTIPNSVTSINIYAFASCTGLTSVTIPSSVTSIGNSAFSDCSGLTSITADPNNTIYDSRNNCNAIIETATNTLIVGCKNTVILNSVTSIGSTAFSGCTGLTSVTIPSSVTSIGNMAFYHTSLTSVTIPDSVTSIGSNVFKECSSLASVIFENNSQLTSIGASAFS